MNLPKRKTRQKMGLRVSEIVRCQSHLQFVRGFECAVPDGFNQYCEGPVEAAHVRSSMEGGIGMKPGDNWTIPLCSGHHRHQHQIGEAAFELMTKLDMKATAMRLWEISPAGKRYRMKQSHVGPTP